jgi:AraC family transcriptional regulator
MARRGRLHTLLREILGHPEVSCRVPAAPPFTLERYRALLDVASIPPLPEKLLWIHTGGKPIAYRARHAGSERVSLPGLVTLVPDGVPGQVALRGVGEGMFAYFDGPRQVPAWVSARREREPVTLVDNVVVTLAQALVAAASEPHRDDEYLATLGNAMLAQVRHALETDGVPLALRGSRSAQVVVHRAVQHIHSHLDAPLDVAGLARTAGVGVTHFSATFRRMTGTTPHRYVLRARIERAQELLRMTGLSVAEIAAAVGFAGQSHFCTAFSRETGVTPTRYRRHCREAAR